MTGKKFSRRDCLRFAAGSVLTLPFAHSVWGAQAQAVLPQAFDEVDHFDVAHRVRDGWKTPVPEPSAACEVVIVGGGISALTAAWRLADRKIMLLEKEAETGGNSRAREFAGCRYALGAFMNQGPMAPFEEFFRDLNVPLVEVPGRNHAWAGAGRMVRDPLGAGLGQLPFAVREIKALEQATALLHRYQPRTAGAHQGIFFPRAENSEALRALDRTTLWAEYERLGLGTQGRNFYDALISARVGDSGEMLSAWMGSYLLSSAVARNYTAPGGHAVFSQALRRRIPANVVRTGFTVTRVAQRPEGKVWVTGSRADGQVETIEAETAILGVPKFYCMRMVEGLAHARPNALSQFTYNAYLVAQVFLRERIDVPFETCAPGNFARFIVAPDQLPGNARSDGGGLLTIYIPYPRTAGRERLFSADAKMLAERIVRDVESVFPAARGKVETVTLYRWGHPMLTTRPGMDDALEQARESFGRVAFAHSDSFGITGLYSAIWTGMNAEAEARAILMS